MVLVSNAGLNSPDGELRVSHPGGRIGGLVLLLQGAPDLLDVRRQYEGFGREICGLNEDGLLNVGSSCA